MESSKAEYHNDLAFNHMLSVLSDDKLRIWNSIKLFKKYQDHDGVALSRSGFIETLHTYFDGELLILFSPGYANIVAFRTQAAALLKIVKDDDDSDINDSIAKVAKQVIRDCKTIELDNAKYIVNIDKLKADESVSTTLQALLAAISPKLSNSLPALMIGNMVTSILRNQPTDLQVSLGILFRDSKLMLGYTYDYGITCSYDEVLRFKISAAVATAKEPSVQGILTFKHGLIQTVVDNFDVDIHSPNGKLSTHSLAMIVTQPSTTLNLNTPDTITRLRRDNMALSIDVSDGICLTQCVFQKNPPMRELTMPNVSPDFLRCQNVSIDRAKNNNFDFLKDIYGTIECAEFNGYNTRLCRDQGHTLRPKTNIVYLPLIDRTPADPSTIMTAMLKAKVLTENTGQTYVIFTADQQLYRVAVHVFWENQTMFRNFYLRLGGMHLLMSYVGCIGSLMVDSGIVEVLSVAFGGVLKMLSGKKSPDNVRALRMLLEEVHRPVFDRNALYCFDDLQRVLKDISVHNKTAKLWVTCLINPVFTIMRYVRAEREADWALHLATVKEMMPLFFAAGHFDYARYGFYYLKSMEAMPDEVRQHFLQGQHTMHHKAGLFNGIWSDMAIETTFMRYGHGRSGIVGITLKPETLNTWAYSLHACNKVVNSLDSMRSHDQQTSQTHDKEEMKARIKSDAEDRKVIREKLELCMDPLYNEHHRDGLVNIVTGRVVTHPSVNVDNVVAIGTTQMQSFQEGFPTSFHKTIPNRVKTMAFSRKHIKRYLTQS